MRIPQEIKPKLQYKYPAKCKLLQDPRGQSFCPLPCSLPGQTSKGSAPAGAATPDMPGKEAPQTAPPWHRGSLGQQLPATQVPASPMSLPKSLPPWSQSQAPRQTAAGCPAAVAQVPRWAEGGWLFFSFPSREAGGSALLTDLANGALRLWLENTMQGLPAVSWALAWEFRLWRGELTNY